MSTSNTAPELSCIYLEELATEIVVVSYPQNVTKVLKEFRARIAAKKIQRAFRARDEFTIKRRLLCRFRETTGRLRQQLEVPRCQDWAICPITQEPIREPAWCRTDGRVYEHDAIVRTLRISERSPMNNLPTTSADLCVYVQPVRPTPVQLGDLSRVNALWEKHQQSGLSVQCSECNHQFPLRRYSTCEQWLRAMDQHHRAKHT